MTEDINKNQVYQNRGPFHVSRGFLYCSVLYCFVIFLCPYFLKIKKRLYIKTTALKKISHSDGTTLCERSQRGPAKKNQGKCTLEIKETIYVRNQTYNTGEAQNSWFGSSGF